MGPEVGEPENEPEGQVPFTVRGEQKLVMFGRELRPSCSRRKALMRLHR